MAYERGWHLEANVLYSPASVADLTRYTMWRLKALLLGQTGAPADGRWTCLGSSDGVTGGMDGVDRLGAAYDASKFVFGASSGSSAHSWIALRSPALVVNGVTRYSYLTLGLAVGLTGADAYLRKAFTSAAPTGGNATTQPTMNGATATDAWTGWNEVSNNTATPVRFHTGLSSAGDFYFFHVRTGTTFVQWAAMHASVVNPKSSDLYPFWSKFQWNNTAAGGSLGFNYLLGTTQQPHPTTPNTGINGVALLSPYFYRAAQNLFAPAWSGTDIIDGTIPDMPLFVGADNMIRGRLPDFGVLPYKDTTTFIVPTGSITRDAQNNVEFAVFGGLLVPYNAAPDLS